jgi:hypothetical protein
MATNTNTQSTTEKYTFDTIQQDNIANIDITDPYPSDAGTLPGGFNNFNIEAVLGTFSVTNAYVNGEHSHFAWAIPYSSSGGSVYTLPNQVMVKCTGFRTDDTDYNGCIRFSTSRTPNSSGISPIWNAINADGANYAAPGAACDRYIDMRTAAGVRLLPIKASLFNAGVHFPTTHYVLRTF